MTGVARGNVVVVEPGADVAGRDVVDPDATGADVEGLDDVSVAARPLLVHAAVRIATIATAPARRDTRERRLGIATW